MNSIFIKTIFAYLIFIFLSCNNSNKSIKKNEDKDLYVKVLGTIQDAGFPQIGCMKACCREKWNNEAKNKFITALGLIDVKNKQKFLFEASPDFKGQTKLLSNCFDTSEFSLPDAIFLTHAHIGHYVGLMHLGREAMNAKNQKVYCLPKLKHYLENNGPWKLLTDLNNVNIEALKADSLIKLNNNLNILPFEVPHRGEYSETAGYHVIGPNKKLLFIPDIDKWHLWEKSILDEIKKVDYALLDATFYKNGEVGNRDMSEIPHPFIEESLELFDKLDAQQRSKIYFIHFNHTNPAFKKGTDAYRRIKSLGYNIAEEGMELAL